MIETNSVQELANIVRKKGLMRIGVDGVCLLKVLDNINTQIDTLIYVKRMRYGRWADKTECEIDDDVESVLTTIKETLQLAKKTKEPPETLGLTEEIIRYHAEYVPQSKADIIYLRNNTPRDKR